MDHTGQIDRSGVIGECEDDFDREGGGAAGLPFRRWLEKHDRAAGAGVKICLSVERTA